MNFATRAALLDELLQTHQAYWRFNVYRGAHYQHIAKHTELLQFLLALSDEQVQALQGDDSRLLNSIAPHFPVAASILSLITLDSPPPIIPVQEPPPGVPGRKWQQISAFLKCHTTISRPAVEWCSGKGYLSTAISQRFSLPAVGLEIDPQLVEAGNCFAYKHHTEVKIIDCDVLSDSVYQHIEEEQHVLALHACGGLHQRMLSLAVAQHCKQISLAPCCYHRFVDEYASLSAQLKLSPLHLTSDDLRTAVRQTNTARKGETQARRTLQAWHLGFRELLRHKGLASHTPLPSLPQHWSKTGFAAFCQRLEALTHLKLALPPHLDAAENAGWALLRQAERIDLVRMAFRRAIEMRCVLDSVLFLEEQGYRCSLATFCQSELSPRNLLIQAQLPSSD